LHAGLTGGTGSPGTAGLEVKRRALVEWLDRLVEHEHYYRQANGRFSQLLARLALPVPAALGDAYQVQITEAGPEQLRIVAFSERDADAEDRVTIDQDFDLRANFPLPGPRPGYLRFVALKTLKAMERDPAATERTSFRDFFRYEIRRDSQRRVVTSAVGVRDPIAGERLELGPNGLSGASEAGILAEAFEPVATGAETGEAGTAPGADALA
jgi:hypothetical protein